MRKFKNIRGCVLRVGGVGTIQPNEIVEVSDSIENSFLTAPDTWEEVQPKRKIKKKPSIFVETKIEKSEE
jgi:hypothetical protein